MFKASVIINDNANVYIYIRNWMEYSIDESIEYEDLIIDLHKNERTNEYLLVGIEIKSDDYIKLIDLEKTEYTTSLDSCYIKFYPKNIINNYNYSYTINHETNTNIQIHWYENKCLMGVIVKRDIKKEINNLTNALMLNKIE